MQTSPVTLSSMLHGLILPISLSKQKREVAQYARLLNLFIRPLSPFLLVAYRYAMSLRLLNRELDSLPTAGRSAAVSHMAKGEFCHISSAKVAFVLTGMGPTAVRPRVASQIG